MNRIEKENREKLFKLMQENPELPVVPMVDAEICEDGFGLWKGSLGSVRLDEYLIPSDFKVMMFKSENNVLDVLSICLSPSEFETLSDREEGRPLYDALPWKKAIIVEIDLPDIKACGWGGAL